MNLFERSSIWITIVLCGFTIAYLPQYIWNIPNNLYNEFILMWVNIYPSSLFFTLACAVILLLKVISLKPIIKRFHLYYLASLLCVLGVLIIGSLLSNLMGVTNYQIVLGGISSVLFLVAHWFYRKAFLAQINDLDEYNSLNYDTGIRNSSEDILNRENIAERVFAIINTTEKRSNRIAICGQWGDGKTSVMNMVKEKCPDSEFVLVWFNPWLYKTKNDLWVGFRMAFEDAVIKHSQGTFMPFIWTRLITFFAALVSLKVAKLPIGKAIEKLIQSSGTPNQNMMKRNVETLLKQYLNDRKVIIFIDDLDRVEDTKVTLDLLMGIKELLDLRSIDFIVAFDEDVVAKIIEKNMPGNGGRHFLEKIIDYRIYLPNPVQSEITCLIKNQIPKLRVNEQVIRDIQYLLPSNPRNLKRFLHYLDMLHPTLERFDDDEVNLHLIYIAQLLSLEFPEAIRNIIKNPYCQKFFMPAGVLEKAAEMYVATKNLGSAEAKQAEQEWGKKYYSDISTTLVSDIQKLTSDNKARLGQLIKEIQERIYMTDQYEYDILFNFRVIEYPQLMSRKEFANYFQQIQSKKCFVDVISKIDAQEEYLMKLVNYRLKQIRKINSFRTKDESDQCESEVWTSGEQLNFLMDCNKLKSYSIKLKSHMFCNLLEETVAIIKVKGEADKLLQQTSGLINKLIDSVKDEAVVLYDILEREEHKVNYHKPTIHTEEFEEKIRNNVLENLIAKFQNPNAILNILLAEGFEARILLKKSSFHTEEIYKRLDVLAVQASINPTIRNNFHDYLEYMIRHAVDNTGFMPREDIVEILKEDKLIKLLCDAVSSIPLTRHTTDFFERYREPLENLGIRLPI